MSDSPEHVDCFANHRLKLPSEMTPARWRDLLQASGWARLDIDSISFGWLLAASARK